MVRKIIGVAAVASYLCANGFPAKAQSQAETALADLRGRIEATHASRDAKAFGALHTESVVFEWQGRATPLTGRADLIASRLKVWAPRADLRLILRVSELRVHSDRAYEFGSYEETWTNPDGRGVIERGRFVNAYLLEKDGRWRVSRTFGFTDSTSTK
jgi:ketosteroid isomerase-like protein